jgi:hypothetical protein
MMRAQDNQHLTRSIPALAMLAALIPAFAWPQASWVGDVLIGSEPTNSWIACNPCSPKGPPNTNWSTDRIPGDDGPLGDPGTGAVIGPDFVVDQPGGGTLDLSTLNVQGGLNVGGLINISDSATINNINLESGGALAGPGPVILTGSGTWNGFLRSGGGVTNQATLTVATGDLETDLINSATLVINPSLNFTNTPSTLTNNGSIVLDTDTALFNSSDIFDGSGAANLLLNQGLIAKSGAELSVIQAPGNHAGGMISASDGTLRIRNDWQFSGGSMQVANNGQIELTGNGDHVINGTSGISGQGSLLVNMASFGTLTVTEPFTVDLTGNSDQGLLLQGFGINLDSTLTNRQGGRWSGGRINGTGAGRLLNEAPLSNPFRIVGGLGTPVLDGDMDSTGWIEQSSNVRVDAPHRLLIASGGGLTITDDSSSVDWNGDGEVVNAGEITIQDGARSRFPARFSQVDGGQLVTEGELDLRGGGMWSGNTDTVIKGDGSVVMLNKRFEFGSGTHKFSDENPTATFPLLISFAELLTIAQDAVVIFDISGVDESLEVTATVNMRNSSAIGGSGRFENRGFFLWEGGEFGIDGMIEFTNAVLGFLEIQGSSRRLHGHLINQGLATGGLIMEANATIDNHGSWTLEPNDSIDTSDPTNPATFNNDGRLSITNAANASINARLNNTNRVTVFAGSTLQINGPVDQLQDGVLSGGTWAIGAGATLIFPESFTVIGPGTVVRGLQSITDSEVTQILSGAATVTGEFTTSGDLEISGGGRITFDGQSSTDVPGGVQNGTPGQQPSITEMLTEAIVIAGLPEMPDARVTASPPNATPATRGTLTPVLTTPLFDNHAILAPGGIGLPGPFNLDGDLVMHPGSTLDIDIAGADPVDGHDRLAVTGSTQLGGTLQITLADDFTPAIGQQFVIVTSTAMTGSFADLTTTNRPDIIWNLFESDDQLILTVADIALFSDRFEAP